MGGVGGVVRRHGKALCRVITRPSKRHHARYLIRSLPTSQDLILFFRTSPTFTLAFLGYSLIVKVDS